MCSCVKIRIVLRLLNRFEVEWMIREANVNDYIDIHKICCQDLGYDCVADLVKERLKDLDASREKVFVAIIDGKVVGDVHAEQYNTLYFASLGIILG